MTHPHPPFVDAHCHLADPRIFGTADEAIAQARAARVGIFVQGGVDPDDWRRQAELALRYPGSVYPCYGLHPLKAASFTDQLADRAIEELPGFLPGAVALGELGLDHGPRAPDNPESRERQARIFRRQLGIAREQKRPLVLHVVKAHAVALEILKKEGIPEQGGMVHSFSGSPENAREYLKLGLHLSISGSIAKKGFERVKKAVLQIPMERLVIESDAPDQAPPEWAEAHPGPGTNSPESLIETARALGLLLKKDADEILEIGRRNASGVFGLPQVDR